VRIVRMIADSQVDYCEHVFQRRNASTCLVTMKVTEAHYSIGNPASTQARYRLQKVIIRHGSEHYHWIFHYRALSVSLTFFGRHFTACHLCPSCHVQKERKIRNKKEFLKTKRIRLCCQVSRSAINLTPPLLHTGRITIVKLYLCTG